MRNEEKSGMVRVWDRQSHMQNCVFAEMTGCLRFLIANQRNTHDSGKITVILGLKLIAVADTHPDATTQWVITQQWSYSIAANSGRLSYTHICVLSKLTMRMQLFPNDHWDKRALQHTERKRESEQQQQRWDTPRSELRTAKSRHKKEKKKEKEREPWIYKHLKQ